MIKFYQVVKNRSLFSKRHLALGKYYFGGFESSMSRREAALILNVRYLLIIYIYIYIVWQQKQRK